jgi:Zn-dependent protease
MLRYSLLEILYILPGILFGLSVHEFFHAYIASKLGDPTPKQQGRLTLNPLKHIDPIGLILILLVGFGWAKPVQINHSYLKNPKRDDILIAAAGPVSNIFVGIIFLFILKISISMNSEALYSISFYSAYINFVLAVFNIIPIYPLDGFHVLSNIIGLRNFKVLSMIQRYSTVILIALILTNITTYIVGIPAQFLMDLFKNLII